MKDYLKKYIYLWPPRISEFRRDLKDHLIQYQII